MPGRAKDSYNIRSVENALHLLEALADEESGCSLAQLSQRLDMTKASLFRMMATFENHGYVQRGSSTGEYELGLSAFEVSQKLLSKMSLLRKAKPAMAQLVRRCNETAYLVIQRDNEALFLEMLDSAQKVKVIPLTNQRFPLQQCAAGKIILAFNEAYAPRTTDHPELLAEISRCRKQGYCIDNNGVGEGSTCMAVPLFKSDKILAGCLTLIAPSFRTDESRINRELLPALKATGEMISAQLGYNVYAPRSIP
ncbi:transcriptional regulator, IclR family [Desulfuromusa kysingii]|uniref:Transcriptional regulator, IclR family n=1 Tax=Desulfuromusa kysingii TaxID=37625 RepID=A0A1H3WYR9_9BACT|nr:IclR family transcriptional regulator [Desulfuromusa kysingii]SDZ92347.1 transcriptional regulator, IclR family [Desulfuromusa kysingii]